MSMILESPVIRPQKKIPEKYTADGRDVSPPLYWDNAPEGTTEFALLVEDPDAPHRAPWVHWLLFSIPRQRDHISENSAGGGFVGRNSWGRTEYNGPKPPPGHGPHRYRFVLYAMDEPMRASWGAPKEEVIDEIRAHAIDKAELVGTYER